ncbi:MAG TPA: hypothetical protein VHN11_16520 [Xanthobacteraceae bacterium]|nr:hypothetical protein [Xanthobacteraceae bacterium]
MAAIVEAAADEQEPVGTYVRNVLEKRFSSSTGVGKTNNGTRKSRTARPVLRPIPDDD